MSTSNATPTLYEATRKSILFNIDAFLERLGNRKRKCLCSKQCFKSMSRGSLEKHSRVLELYRTLQVDPDQKSRVFWSWVMSLYLLCTNERGNVTGLRLPAFPRQTFCLMAWVDLLDIKISTFHRLKKSILLSRDVVRDVHGNVGSQLALKLEVQKLAKEFILEQALRLAHSLPMYLSASDGGGICDVCMAFRHKMRMVDDCKVKPLSEAWGRHLVYAVDSRDEHNRCRNAALSAWGTCENSRLSRADISADYAKQAYLPVVAAGTTKDYFIQKQGLDVNLFGIFNEGSGVQTTMVSTEGARHDSNSVVSQLHYYMKHIQPRVGTAKELYLHMDSCTGQNRNNIVLGYFMLRVFLGYHDRVVLKFMTVGHTKFGPDRVFGHIKRRMKQEEALSIDEFLSKIVSGAADCSEGFHFDHYGHVRDYKSGTNKLFKKLPGFRSKFYYSITIDGYGEQDRDVSVHTSTSPGGDVEDSYTLRKHSFKLQTLDCSTLFPLVQAKAIGSARRKSLRDDILNHIKQRFPDRDSDVDAWWGTFLAYLDNHASENQTSHAENIASSSSTQTCPDRNGASVLSFTQNRKRRATESEQSTENGAVIQQSTRLHANAENTALRLPTAAENDCERERWARARATLRVAVHAVGIITPAPARASALVTRAQTEVSVSAL
eukprot:IDg10739t1